MSQGIGTTIVSVLFLLLGFVMIKTKTQLGIKAAHVYQKLGLDVPEEQYAKQFKFVGILLMIIGFLGATGLLQYI